MNINWREIKEKYPKAFKLLLYFLNQENKICYRRGDSFNSPYLREKIKTICYCDLEKFFDEQGIIIQIYHNPIDKKLWVFDIDYFNNNECVSHLDNRIEAQIQAIYEAFKILNNMIKDGTIK